MRFFAMLFVTFGAAAALLGQEPGPQPGAQADPNAWTSKTIKLKYLDPEQLRSLFSNRSYIMEANRELKALKVNGPETFVKEVEDTAVRLDVAPRPPADIQITVYLLATAGQPLPAELKGIDSGLAGLNSSEALRLADTQVLRLREGQTGEVSLTDTKAAPGPALTRVRVQSAIASGEPKLNRISLDGVRCWVTKPPTPPETAPVLPRPDGDFIANIDLVPNQAAVLAQGGTEKPLVLAVRALVVNQ